MPHLKRHCAHRQARAAWVHVEHDHLLQPLPVQGNLQQGSREAVRQPTASKMLTRVLIGPPCSAGCSPCSLYAPNSKHRQAPSQCLASRGRGTTETCSACQTSCSRLRRFCNSCHGTAVLRPSPAEHSLTCHNIAACLALPLSVQAMHAVAGVNIANSMDLTHARVAARLRRPCFCQCRRRTQWHVQHGHSISQG